MTRYLLFEFRYFILYNCLYYPNTEILKMLFLKLSDNYLNLETVFYSL
jgi:hypothetical protein